MSTTNWHRLCEFDALTSGEARKFDVEGTPVALVRINDTYYAVNDICTHQRVSLSEGEVHTDTCELECWKHGSRFSLIDGVPSVLPATKPVAVYPVKVTDDGIEVELP